MKASISVQHKGTTESDCSNFGYKIESPPSGQTPSKRQVNFDYNKT